LDVELELATDFTNSLKFLGFEQIFKNALTGRELASTVDAQR
jgi:hypothetical protein